MTAVDKFRLFFAERLSLLRIPLIMPRCCHGGKDTPGGNNQDATAVATKNANFTALSLATKSSYKDKATGKYIDHTEWHRCIAWGKLADYAKTLKKGAHLSVEGELRSRERVDKKTSQKQRIWEVRVSSILKLDRAEKAGPEEASGDDFNPEEEAA